MEQNSSRDFGDKGFGIGTTQTTSKSRGKISCSIHLLNNLARYGNEIQTPS